MKKRILHCAIAVAMTAGAGVMSLSQSYASSHREAPNITRSPKVDSTDFYMFNSYESGRDGYVTLIANYMPFQDPTVGGPNYHSMDPSALYEIHIDNNGDAEEDVTFQFRFKNKLSNNGEGITLKIGPEGNEETVAVAIKQIGGVGGSAGTDNLGFLESYTLSMITGDRKTGRKQKILSTDGVTDTFTKPFDNVGNKTFGAGSAYADYARQFISPISIPGCGEGKVFVGQRKDSFVVNLGETFDLVNYTPVEGGIEQSTLNDSLANKNITTLALEVPVNCLTAGSSIIGGWTSASLQQVRILNPKARFAKPEVNGGAFTQVSRLGSPLVNELVVGLKDKDRFSVSEPKDDSQFATYVTNPTLPAILDVLFRDALGSTVNVAPTNFPRTDLVAVFLTGIENVNQPSGVKASEMLRLNTAIDPVAADLQSNFGVAGDDLAGFPNGRRPGDDVVDIALRVVMGRLCHPVPVNSVDTNLGFCTPEQAIRGTVPFTDGAPISAADFDVTFPYLKAPLAGSLNK